MHIHTPVISTKHKGIVQNVQNACSTVAYRAYEELTQWGCNSNHSKTQLSKLLNRNPEKALKKRFSHLFNLN